MAAGAAVAIAVLIAAIVSYLVVKDQLVGQVDSALKAQAAAVINRGQFALGGGFGDLPPNAGGPAPYAQVVAADGSVLGTRGGLQLPADGATRSVAAGDSNQRARGCDRGQRSPARDRVPGPSANRPVRRRPAGPPVVGGGSRPLEPAARVGAAVLWRSRARRGPRPSRRQARARALGRRRADRFLHRRDRRPLQAYHGPRRR